MTGVLADAGLGDVEAWSGKGSGDENFPVGSWLIAPKLRPHIHAFYRFARNADDIADHDTMSAAEKLRRLDVMEAVLQGRQSGGAPSAAGLRVSLAQTGVSDTHALDLLRAFAQDAEKTRYASWDELYVYCRYSAMPVGRYLLDLHGETNATWVASDALCVVLQVLNHLQDGAKDLANLDRCYLPADMLAVKGGTVAQLNANSESDPLRQVKFCLLDRCNALLLDAQMLPGQVADRRLRLESAIIVGLAWRLSARLRRHDPLAMRVKLGAADMLAACVKSLRYLP